METWRGLTYALSKVLHCDVLVLPAGDGPQLALVSIGHPIGATHLLQGDSDGQREGENRFTSCRQLKRRLSVGSYCPAHLQRKGFIEKPTLVLVFSLQSGEGHSQ